MNVQEFEGAQKKEPLTVVEMGGGFCQGDKDGEGFQLERAEHMFSLLLLLGPSTSRELEGRHCILSMV